MLIALLTLNAAGQCTGYQGGEPGSIGLVQPTHTAGTGNYAIQFSTEKRIRTAVPANVVVGLVDSTNRALVWKLQAPVIFTPYATPVKYLYTVQFNIIVTQVNCLLLGLCTTLPADPDTAIHVRVNADEFEI